MKIASDYEMRSRAIAAALGQAPFDVLLVNGTVIDAATCETRPADIGVVGTIIASVHPSGSRTDAREIYEASGKFLAPGLIDTHVHFESSHMTPANYAKVVVPQGTTTIFCDPHELANVLGLAGVRYAVEASRDLPLRMICTAPSSVPSAPGLEISGAEFAGAEMREMLSWNEIAGISEVMDMEGVLKQSERMTGILAAGLASGKVIEGHARGLAGAALQAYMAAGVTSDHEITSGEDVLQKLRAGLTVEIRGSHDYVLKEVVAAINTLPQIPSTLTICTDDVFPDDLVANGGMKDVLRRLIEYGLDPIQAIRCATLNASIRIRRNDLGLLAAGRTADIVVLSNLRGMVVENVFVSGQRATQAGRLILPAVSTIEPPAYEMKISPLTPDDCKIRVPGVASGRAKIRMIEGVRFPSWGEKEVEVKDGFAVVPEGFSVLLMQHRHGKKSAHPQTALMAGWGELHGAAATTYSHDSHNLAVLGRDPVDMCAAANALIACGGGIAVAKGGQVIAKVELPIAGVLSLEPGDVMAAAFVSVKEAAGKVIEWQPPYRTFKALTATSLACNPGPHLTDLGLTDGSTGEIVDTVVTSGYRS
jgi:adenine deaminase